MTKLCHQNDTVTETLNNYNYVKFLFDLLKVILAQLHAFKTLDNYFIMPQITIFPYYTF